MSFKYTWNEANRGNRITNCIFIKSRSQNRLRKIIKVKTWHEGQLPKNDTRQYNVKAKRSGSDVKSQVKPWTQILLARLLTLPVTQGEFKSWLSSLPLNLSVLEVSKRKRKRPGRGRGDTQVHMQVPGTQLVPSMPQSPLVLWPTTPTKPPSGAFHLPLNLSCL